MKGISDHRLEERFNVGIGRGRIDRVGHREERRHLIGERAHYEIVGVDLIRSRHELRKEGRLLMIRQTMLAVSI